MKQKKQLNLFLINLNGVKIRILMILKKYLLNFVMEKKQLEKYKNKRYKNAPIWILSLYWSFGNTIKIYKYLNKTIKNEIAKELIRKFERKNNNSSLMFILIMLNDLRNIICHNNVLYNFNYKNNIKEIISFIKDKINPNFEHNSIRIIDALKIIEYILPRSKIKKIFINKFEEEIVKNEDKFDKKIIKKIKRYLYF